MKQKPMHRFSIGDTVRVVDKPYRDCPFGWIGPMDRFCGTPVVIEGLNWSESHKCYAYRIDADNDKYSWCANCFEEVQSDIKESDLDISMLFQ